jgi:hypothetical protein
MEGDEGRDATGAVVSPLLANIYLHYVFDLWVNQWRGKWAHGDMIVVSYADDAVLEFERREDAEGFREQLGERMRKVGGFTHICGKTRKGGWFTVGRRTVKKRLRSKLQAVRQELRKRWHERIAETGGWLRSVVQGYLGWERFRSILDRYLPLPCILHPEPGVRFDARHPR